MSEQNLPDKSNHIGRLGFIGRLAALGAATLAGTQGVFAQQSYNSEFAAADAGVDWKSVNNLVIRRGRLVSMDEKTGDLPETDIHINNGKIISIARGIRAEGATEINGEGMIVLPGLIETHWHIWTSVLRALSGAKPGKGYFDITSSFGKYFTPDDMYNSSRLALNEAIYSGITYVHDWCHNVRSPAHAEAGLRAIKDAGIGARFSVGLPAGAEDDDSIDLDLLKNLKQNRKSYTTDELVSFGLAWPGPQKGSPIRLKELETARSLGFPVSVHAGRKPDGEDSIGKLKEYLGADMQVIHGITTTQEEFNMMATAGSSLSISPYSELRIGYGFPPVPEMLKSGVNLGLSVDTFPLSGNADMFAVMKAFLNIGNALSKDEFLVSGKRILETATIEGARSLGIDKITGSITPGKRADIIMVNTKAPNMWPVEDAVQVLVTAAQPSNVDTVIINGKVAKRAGVVVGADQEKIYAKSSETLTRVKKLTGW